jgi:hypothetical protein
MPQIYKQKADSQRRDKVGRVSSCQQSERREEQEEYNVLEIQESQLYNRDIKAEYRDVPIGVDNLVGEHSKSKKSSQHRADSFLISRFGRAPDQDVADSQPIHLHLSQLSHIESRPQPDQLETRKLLKSSNEVFAAMKERINEDCTANENENPNA